MQFGHGLQAVGLEGYLPGQKLVEGNGERVDVAAQIRGRAGDLLRCGVVGRAHEPARGLLVGSGQPEVCDLDLGPLGAGGNVAEQDIRWLDVAVDHSTCMGGGQGAGGLDHVFKGVAPRQWSILF